MAASHEKEFVDGWTISQTLGEGAYGEVKLLINRHSGDAVAMKMIDLKKHPTAVNSVKKEVAIQRNLQHANILKYFGKRTQGDTEFIFLEYAAGGELFDRIEPDIGMKPQDARRYFKQLLAGVEFLHDKGIAHRDLKPENLLLDVNDNIKISDFGMATMFRLKGRERQLTTKCGTLPYVAPEVLVKPYNATPADIWSCGIVLVTLLAGELPWDQPTTECREFVHWKQNKYETLTPWSKLDTLVISLLRKMLTVDPVDRITLSKLLQHPWCQIDLSLLPTKHQRSIDDVDNGEGQHAKRLRSSHDFDNGNDDSLSLMCLSQPMPSISYSITEPDDVVMANRNAFCFSQPTMFDDLLFSTQMNATQCANPFQRLVKRMTRFFVTCETLEEALNALTTGLDQLGFKWKLQDKNRSVIIMTKDRRKTDLIYRANLIEMDGKILMDFRLSRGCGLDFKRGFIKIRDQLGNIVSKGPTTWPIAFATDTLP